MLSESKAPITSRTRRVVAIADFDDPDVAALWADLEARPGFEVTWCRLGKSPDDYCITVTMDDARVEVDGELVTSALVHSADVVIYRRWRACPPRPAVDMGGDPRCAFGNREWNATIEAVLENWYGSAPSARWSRRPFGLTEKVCLMLRAARAGARVPWFSVSNDHRVTAHQFVLKAINVDQRLDSAQRFSTTLVDDGIARELAQGRMALPALVQEYIRSECEWRVVYCFGVIAAVEQRRLEGGLWPIDIRYAAVVRCAAKLPIEVVGQVRLIADELQMQWFTLDVVQDSDGACWIVDINDDGLVCAADDDSQTLGQAVVDGVVSAAGRSAPIGA